MRAMLLATVLLGATAAAANKEQPVQRFASGILHKTGAHMTFEPQAKVRDFFVSKASVNGPCQVEPTLRVVKEDRTFFDQIYVVDPRGADYFEPRAFEGRLILHSSQYQNVGPIFSLFTQAPDGRGVNTVAPVAESFAHLRQACIKA